MVLENNCKYTQAWKCDASFLSPVLHDKDKPLQQAHSQNYNDTKRGNKRQKKNPIVTL